MEMGARDLMKIMDRNNR